MKSKVLITHNREKLLNALIYFSKNTKACGKTKLFKLLYFLDFIHFRETGKSVTGLDYYAWERGPVPQDLFFEMEQSNSDLKETIALLKAADDDDSKLCRIISKRPCDLKWFSKRELRLLETLSYIFKDAPARDIVEITHLPGTPWDRTMREKGKGKKIDYRLAIDGSKGSLKMEEVEERAAEIGEVLDAFGGQ